ncbi:MAG: PD40 domain-containing protein, partial [Candidatus Solibacter usitatus]|nr:PD40 domain-containing protein [Candidatus Solibacter usitatus]
LRDPLAQPTLLAKVQRRWLAPALAITALTLLAMGGAWWLSTRPVEKPLIQMIADLGSAPAAAGSGIAISRDGTRIALVGSSGGKNIIFYRRLSDEKGVALHGTEGATHPFFSPDGQWIGFFADRRLKRIPSAGGSAMALCDAPAGRGGSWGTDGFIVATLDSAGGIMKIPEGGGTPVTLIERRPEERSLRFPSLLPGGKGILFMVGRDSAHYDASTLEVFSTATRQRKVIREGGRYPRYLASGHIAYHLNDTLFAFPFRLDKLEAEGASVPLLGDVSFGGPGNAFMDVSENGTLVFVRGFSPQIRQKNLLHWVDGKNAPQPLTSEAGGYQPLISPDGTRLVYLASESGPYTAWLKDLHRETTTQLTRVATYGIVWTPDSKHLVYGLDEGGLYWMRSDGGGKPQLLLATPGKMLVHPTSISPDGRKLIYTANLPAAGNFLLPLEPGNDGDIAPKAGKPEPFLDQAGMTPREATFSPDGKWVAFHTSDANGHVYVRPVPDTGGKWQVSGGEGGKSAEWSPNGRELFYIGLDGRIRVVAYTAQGTTFQLGQPRVWAEAMLPLFRATLSASPDGKRIATVIYPPTNDADVKTMVLFNFFDEVKRRIRYNR